jgi:HPt (histidine-containing phosphotransfer) domain-containing protein
MNLSNYQHIAPEYLYEISGNDPEFIKEIIETFAANTPEDLLAIDVALLQRDWLSLQNACHKTKASAKFLGAISLGNLMADLEEYCKQPDLDVALVQQKVAHAKAIYDMVIKDLEHLCSAL